MTDPTDTDPLDPLDPLDELASDHLDGRTTAAEAERVATDPELAARVEALQAVRSALRAEVQGDARTREAAITAALAAYDDELLQERTSALAPVRAPATGRAPTRRTFQLVAIAAALVLLALAVPLLADLDRSDDAQDTAATALDEDSSTESGADLEISPPQPAEDSASGGAAEAYRATVPEDLGAFDDLDALQAAVRGRGLGPADRAVPTTTPTAGDAANPEALAAQPCAYDPAVEGPATYAASARLGEQAVLVLVRTTPAGRELVVLDAADCSVVATRPL